MEKVLHVLLNLQSHGDERFTFCNTLSFISLFFLLRVAFLCPQFTSHSFQCLLFVLSRFSLVCKNVGRALFLLKNFFFFFMSGALTFWSAHFLSGQVSDDPCFSFKLWFSRLAPRQVIFGHPKHLRYYINNEDVCIVFRKIGRETERDIGVREKHGLVASQTHHKQGLNPCPRHVP